MIEYCLQNRTVTKRGKSRTKKKTMPDRLPLSSPWHNKHLASPSFSPCAPSWGLLCHQHQLHLIWMIINSSITIFRSWSEKIPTIGSSSCPDSWAGSRTRSSPACTNYFSYHWSRKIRLIVLSIWRKNPHSLFLQQKGQCRSEQWVHKERPHSPLLLLHHHHLFPSVLNLHFVKQWVGIIGLKLETITDLLMQQGGTTAQW